MFVTLMFNMSIPEIETEPWCLRYLSTKPDCNSYEDRIIRTMVLPKKKKIRYNQTLFYIGIGVYNCK